MKARSETLVWLLERLAPLGPIRAKAMFGGWGLYCDEVFFAIVADEVLYLKVDDRCRPRFEAAGLEPFRYPMRDGRLQTMSYYPLPDAALEDAAALLDWAREGLGAGLRARAAGPAPTARPRGRVPRG